MDIIIESYKMKTAIAEHLMGFAFAIHFGISTKYKGPLAAVMIGPCLPLLKALFPKENLSARQHE